jgi:phenylalanyl-tRNA synthetase beta chain
MSWLRELLPDLDVDAGQVAERLVAAGLEVETVERLGRDLGGVVLGRVAAVEELTGFAKPIRYCQVEVGEGAPRGIICGATNFAAGDSVVVALPGAVLPGGVRIDARSTYGHVSDGMICSARELGLGSEHTGILVLGPDARPGRPAEELLVEDVLDVSVTPDRGYCLSVRGIARETAVAFGLGFRDPAAREPAWPAGAGYPVTVEDAAGCPSYLALTLEPVDAGAAAPSRLRLWLASAGMRAISLVVDASNAVMLELGAPLHAFDRDALRGPIVVRRARAGERLRTLDDVERELDPADLVIADDLGPVALAGVMGGARTEVSAATRAVVLEAAHFDPSSVARTARRHRLPSEAARRFERYVDPAVAPAAAARFAELAGCPQLGTVTVVGLAPALPAVRMDAGHPGRVAGRAVAAATVRERLEQVGATVLDQPALDEPGPDRTTLTVLPPSWRPDLREPADLVEEVLRLEGYDTIPSVRPVAPAGRGLTLAQRRRRALGRALAGAGLVEVSTIPFTAADPLQLPAGDPRRAAARLANPLSEQEAWLRTSLLPGLFGALVRNIGHGTADLALFETGTVVRVRPGAPAAPPPTPAPGRRPSNAELAALDAALPDQPEHVALVLAGELEPAGWWGPARTADWADAVELARLVATTCGARPQVRAGSTEPWHPGRSVELVVDGTVLGHAGELHPRSCAALGLPARTCAAELDLGPLLAAADPPPTAPVVSPYPPAVVDVALVVPVAVPAGAVDAALRDGAGPLLESLTLLDLYTGPPVPAGARSLAYRLAFRAPDRTLAGAEVNAARDAAVELVASRTGAALRT